MTDTTDGFSDEDILAMREVEKLPYDRIALRIGISRAGARLRYLRAARRRDFGECVYCGRPATSHDHVVPRKHPQGGKCGRDCQLVSACHSCNVSKSNRTPDQWLAAGLYKR